MSLESLKSVFNKLEQNKPQSTDLSKGSHSFGKCGIVLDGFGIVLDSLG